MLNDSGDRTKYPTGAVRDCVEVWLPVVGYEGLYEVSNYGRVRSLARKTRIRNKDGLMKFKYDTHGYYRVNLTKNKTQKSLLVSRLVAEAFIPNIDNLPQVGHEDDNKNNNSVFNLYWTNAKENNYHNGKMKRLQKSHNKKIKQIADSLSIPVIGVNIVTGEIIQFDSMQEAGRNGFKSAKISMCCSGKRKSHKGYTWRKKDDIR